MVRPGALPVCFHNTMHCLCHRMYHNVCKYSYLPWYYKLLKTVIVLLPNSDLGSSRVNLQMLAEWNREDNPLIYLTAHTCEQHNSQASGSHTRGIRTQVPFFGALSVFISGASIFFPSLCARLRFNGGSLSPPTNRGNSAEDFKATLSKVKKYNIE